MISNEEIDSLLNRRTDVIGQDGEKLGTLGRIYLDDRTDVPNFATVNTGLFGLKEHFFPLSDARTSSDGLEVPFTKEDVKGAPTIEPDGHLSQDDEKLLYDYYSQPGLGAGSLHDMSRGDAPDVLSVPSPSTREETLTTEYPDAERGRLRKYVVSEAKTRDSTEVPRQVNGGGRHAASSGERPGLTAEGMPESEGAVPEDGIVATPEGPVSRSGETTDSTKD